MDNNPNYYNGNSGTNGYRNGYNSQSYQHNYQGAYNQGYYNQYNYNPNYYNQPYNPQPYYPNYGYSYYQNLYNMFGGHNPIVEKEFAEISRRGVITGALMLAVFFMQIVLSTAIALTPFADLYYNDITFSMGAGIFMQVLYMLLPFMIAYLASSPETKKKMNAFSKPTNLRLYLLGVSAGFAVCLLGNTATSVFAVILEILGVTFYSGAEGMEIPTTVFPIIIFIINTAVAPALLEEFAFRGVIMQPLRKYGDWFAIIVSAFCFAVVHANMVQIPFAFIAGISLGYFCIKTRSIWTSITIHFLNNLLSIIFSVYFEKMPEASVVVYYVVVATLILIGTVAMIAFRMNCNVKMKKDATVMNKNRVLKKAAFITAPTVVIATVFALFTSVNLMMLTNVLGLLTVLAGLFVVGFVIVKWCCKVRSENSIHRRKMYTVSMVITIVSCAFIALMVLSSAGN